MRSATIVRTLALLLLWVSTMEANAQRKAAPSEELNTLLFHATFRVLGPSAKEQGRTSFGTVFVMARPHKDNPKTGDIVIVTAAHVFEDIAGDTATILLRSPAADGNYQTFDFPLPIRKNGKPLYIKHESADVAVMYADLPDKVPITGLTEDFLADDARLEALDIHPGDEAFVLGFPLGVCQDLEGFQFYGRAILRPTQSRQRK